jgi:hypothetical protein
VEGGRASILEHLPAFFSLSAPLASTATMESLQALPGGLLGCAALVIIALASHYVWTYLRSPLRQVPGPFLASVTDLWRVRSWWTGQTQWAQINLHRRLGRAVRLGPNTVSLSDPALINTVYSSKAPWKKVSRIKRCRPPFGDGSDG